MLAYGGVGNLHLNITCPKTLPCGGQGVLELTEPFVYEWTAGRIADISLPPSSPLSLSLSLSLSLPPSLPLFVYEWTAGRRLLPLLSARCAAMSLNGPLHALLCP